MLNFEKVLPTRLQTPTNTNVHQTNDPDLETFDKASSNWYIINLLRT